MAEASYSQDPSERLLISLPEKFATSWPVANKVLEDLYAYDEANSARDAAERAKTSYLVQRTLLMQLQIVKYAIVEALINDTHRKFIKQSVTCECIKDAQAKSESAKSYLLMGISNLNAPKRGKSGEFQHFGMNREFFCQHFQPADVKSVKTILNDAITERIGKLSKSVLSFYKQGVDYKLLFTKMRKFPDVLSEDIENLRQQELCILKDKKSYLKHIEYYCKLVHEGIALFYEKQKLLKLNQTNFSLISQFYAVKTEALSLKVKLLQLQILNDTYTKRTVPALKWIREDLQTKEDILNEELLEKSTLLENYEKVGGAFQDLVNEYSALRIAIKNEKWAFEELKKTEDEE